jgi:hypothetical protein
MAKQMQTGLDEREREAGILDLDHLTRCSQGDRALERELLTLYVEQAQRQMLLAREARDRHSYVLALHTLKGASFALGIVRVAAAVARAEAAGFDAADAGRDAAIAALETDVAMAERSILRHLSRSGREDISALP